MAEGIELAGDGLKVALAGITSLRVFALKEIPDSIPECPCALMLLGETDYDTTFNAHYDTVIRLIILLAPQDKPSAFNTILDYVEETGAKSITAAVKANRTLDGHVQDCKVVRNLGVGGTAWGGIVYLSTEFEIEIIL